METGEELTIGTRGKALVLVQDRRVALASVLVLQEMQLEVDYATDAEAALDWSRSHDYDVVVYGAEQHVYPENYARRLRETLPDTRILMLAPPWSDSEGLDAVGIEVLRPPVNVNVLIGRLWPTAAA